MAVSSPRFAWDPARASAIFLSLSLQVVVAAAQDPKDARQCDGKAAPDLQIENCTAAIDANSFAGNDLALLFNNRGLAYYAKRDIGRAIADFTEATRLDPDFAHGYANRALAHKARGELEPAITDYDQAIRLDPSYAFAFTGRGIAYAATKNDTQAIADFTSAITLDAKDVDAFKGRALAYYDSQDFDHAILDFTAAANLTPGDVAIFYDRAIVFSARHDHEHAIADYTEAVRLDPDNVAAHAGRAASYLRGATMTERSKTIPMSCGRIRLTAMPCTAAPRPTVGSKTPMVRSQT